MADPRTITIPAMANAAQIVPLHAALTQALEGGEAVLLALDGADGAGQAGALALQLLVAAERGAPPGRLTLSPGAEAALDGVTGRGAAA